MEAIQASKCVIVDRGKQIFEYIHDGFRMDGTRYDRGLRHCVPRNQSAETGKLPPPNLDERLTSPAGGCRPWAEISARVAIGSH